MRAIRLVPLFALFVLVGSGPTLLPFDEAFAACCMYCKCKWGCTCPGLGSCPGCRMGEPEVFQARIPIGDVPADNSAADKPLLFPASESDSTDSLIKLVRGGTCAPRNFALRILGEAGEGLRVELSGIDEKKQDDRIAVFQMVASKDR